jgi:hypothetical protein
LSLASVLAPLASNNSTTSLWPFAAKCKSVQPLKVLQPLLWTSKRWRVTSAASVSRSP